MIKSKIKNMAVILVVALSFLLCFLPPDIYAQKEGISKMKDVRYLVTWDVITHISASCPDANKVSEYGTKTGGMSSCAVYHFKVETEKKNKEFNTELEADAFIKGMPTVEFGEGCKNPKKYKITKELLGGK